MIPKIIHYCWFGKKPFSDVVKMCIDTWKTHLPEYKFMLWNESNSPMSHPFVQAAYSRGKYAFVSDYVRLWAVNKFGGIYLDTDMYVVKPFDELLKDRTFLGYEDENTINVAIFGSVPDSAFLNKLMNQYDTIKIPYDLTEIAIPIIVTSTFNSDEAYKSEVTIYPIKTFYPLPQKKRKNGNFLKYATVDSYTIHLWNLSWLSIPEKIILRFIWFGKYIGLLKKRNE